VVFKEWERKKEMFLSRRPRTRSKRAVYEGTLKNELVAKRGKNPALKKKVGKSTGS